MIYSILTPIRKRLRNRSNALLAAGIGLVAVAALVSCAQVNLNRLDVPSAQPAADDAQSRQARSPASLLVRKFERRYETNISLLQYQQADEYLRVTAPGEIGIPVLLSTRYAQTEHMPIVLRGGDESQADQFTGWGFISFVADFDKHVRILEGRLANPAKPGDPYIEAVMMTEKLDKIGAQVGDHLILVYRKRPNGELEPIEVKIVGSWAPRDSKELYWFYDPSYFNEGLMVPEETYIDVILPSWEEIGYEYTWFSVFDADASDTDAIDTGISQIRSNLATIFGEVKIDVWPPEISTQGD